MKTTIYELLGMIKDGKAPKKILYDDMIWRFDDEDKYYWSNGTWLDDYCDITKILNDEVTILETTITYNQDNIENNKQDKIEKIDNAYYHLEQSEQNQLFKNKINEIIDRVN